MSSGKYWCLPPRCLGDGGSTSTGATLPSEEDEGGCPPRPASQNNSGLLLQPESSTGTCAPSNYLMGCVTVPQLYIFLAIGVLL